MLTPHDGTAEPLRVSPPKAAAYLVKLELELDSWVRRALRRLPLKEAAVTTEVALESERVRLPHRDPADRFLAAAARVYGLTLMTADEKLLSTRAVRTFAAK